MAADVTVLVVGAGPTGLLLAAELYRRGMDCRVIDANPAPLHWDRATVVHPRSLEVFESLGILEPLLAAGVKQRTARLHSAGRVLGEIDLVLCGSRYGFNIGISEEVTESILTDYLRGQGGDVLRLAPCRARTPRRRPAGERRAGRPDRAIYRRLGRRLRRSPQRHAEADRNRTRRARPRGPLGGVRRDRAGLAGIIRGELRVPRRDPGHLDRAAARAVARVPAAERRTPTWSPTPGPRCAATCRPSASTK